MPRFCTECGSQIAEGVAFCTECGTKMPNDNAANTVTVQAETAVTRKSETPPAQTAQPVYQQQAYQTPAPAADAIDKVVSTGAYFGLMFLFAIPLIGLIACIIMAFAPKNPNIKNYARAMLIWTIIGLVLTGILIAVIAMLWDSLIDYISQMYY